MQPDEGKVEWSRYVTAGYLDQHSVLEEGQTVRDVLRTAFDELFTAEARINDLYMATWRKGADVDALMEEVGELQERLESRDFYTLDAKIDEVACSWGHGLWHGYRCDLLVRVGNGPRSSWPNSARKPDILLLDEPTNYLDAEHIDWLKRYLQNYENAFVPHFPRHSILERCDQYRLPCGKSAVNPLFRRLLPIPPWKSMK